MSTDEQLDPPFKNDHGQDDDAPAEVRHDALVGVLWRDYEDYLTAQYDEWVDSILHPEEL